MTSLICHPPSCDPIRFGFDFNAVAADVARTAALLSFPRQAALLGCRVITGRRGAAANASDVPIQDRYKFADSRRQIPRITRTIRDVLLHYDAWTQDCEVYRQVIRGEYGEFVAQALRVFSGRLQLPPGDA
jgi:hypothetical protein